MVALDAPYELMVNGTYSMPAMVATPDETTMKMGFSAFCSSGRVAWYKRTTPAALTSTCSIRSDVFISDTL